jgi:hypothetical protein
MLRRFFGLSSTAVCLSALFGAPIALLLLLLANYVPWWDATLGKHTWLSILLVAIVASHLVVGGVLYRESRRVTQFLLSPEGKRRRAGEVRKSIAAIITRAEAKPRLELEEVAFEGLPPRNVMVEARRLAKSIAKDELRRSGVRSGEFDAMEITRIADALVGTNLNIIETAKANLEKRASIVRTRGGVLKS